MILRKRRRKEKIPYELVPDLVQGPLWPLSLLSFKEQGLKGRKSFSVSWLFTPPLSPPPPPHPHMNECGPGTVSCTY